MMTFLPPLYNINTENGKRLCASLTQKPDIVPSTASLFKHLISNMAFCSVLTFLSCVLAVDASIASRHANKNQISKQQDQPSRPVPNDYLNNKTQPYWVNGSALPEVDFNIGESYSGLLPIDDSKELFFWFVPSTNPAASEEITIWLNG